MIKIANVLKLMLSVLMALLAVLRLMLSIVIALLALHTYFK
ncbi:hypothetical protein [Paenibacillus sp. GP183]|nr:hypothetical protein [Paenibacillus sp. GP183]